MKFELGDKVVVKHSNEDGKVVEILNDKMVLVEVRGVRFPAYTDQLDFPYFKQFSSKPLVAAKTDAPPKKYIDQIKTDKQTTRYAVAEGVWLVLVPVFSKDVFDDDVVEALKIYVVNQTQAGLHFHAWLRIAGVAKIEITNQVHALHDFYLFDLDFEELNDAPALEFEFSLITPQKDKPEYYEAIWKPKAKQVFKQIEQLKEKGHAFFSHLLFTEYPTKPVQEEAGLSHNPGRPGAGLDKLAAAGFKVVAGKKIPGQQPPPPSVIDLHIEKLTQDYGSMSAHEKLMLQLREFDKWLHRVEEHYMKQVWVIHGLGSGRLKEEIHELLKHRTGVKSFVNQYHPWYGHGATEIYLD